MSVLTCVLKAEASRQCWCDGIRFSGVPNAAESAGRASMGEFHAAEVHVRLGLAAKPWRSPSVAHSARIVPP